MPDGDLYKSIRRGDAEIVTDTIETFTAHGVRLASGRELDADIIVTATGLNLLVFGGIEIAVDGEAVSVPDAVAYNGMMLSGVPNFVYAIGYTNSSWTLKVDLVCEYFCRLLGYLDGHGYDACVPELGDSAIELRPLLDFEAGYVLRALDELPKQGDTAPWNLTMNYAKDARHLRRAPLDDGAMRFFAAEPAVEREAVPVAG